MRCYKEMRYVSWKTRDLRKVLCGDVACSWKYSTDTGRILTLSGEEFDVGTIAVAKL